MKKIILLGVLLTGPFLYQAANAQVRVGVNVNIGNQPAWGPEGYDYVDYYYLPDIEAYYYVPQRQFIYMDRGRWIFTQSLPPRYRGYDLYNGYKVVINEPRPYLHHERYRDEYREYRGHRGQIVIRDSRDERYKPYRRNWERDGRRDRDDRHDKDDRRHRRD